VTTPDHRCTDKPSLGEISELIAWARRLSDAGITDIPAAELAAYQAAKHNLLARINALEPENQ
jgi:hypothetical protein